MRSGVARPAGRSCARSSSVHCTERRTTANSAPSPDGTRPSHSVVTVAMHGTTPNCANQMWDGRRLTPGKETWRQAPAYGSREASRMKGRFAQACGPGVCHQAVVRRPLGERLSLDSALLDL